MKYINFITLFFFPIFSANFTECGNEIQPGSVDDLHYNRSVKEWRESENSYNAREYYWAPVTWHVVRETNGQGGVSLDRLDQGILDLNLSYNPRGIRFYQFGDIDTIDNSEYYFNIDSYDEIVELRNINNVEGTINVYIVASLSTGDNSLCGISTFTWYESQGIIIADECFSTPDNHSTLPHEVGHYFDIVHTHSGSPAPDEDGVVAGPGCEFSDFTECEVRGDDLCDTPADPNLDDIIDNNCDYAENYLDGHGDYFDPPTHNFMSYSDKYCRNQFSEQQLDKALHTLISLRPELDQPSPVPYISMIDYNWVELFGDGDNLQNRGESARINFSFYNWLGFPNGENFTVTLTSENPDISISNSSVVYDLIQSGDTLLNSIDAPEIQLDEFIALGTHELLMTITAEGHNGYFWDEIPIEVHVTMDQVGFPILTEFQINGSPAIIDLDGNGSKEILFGDYSGFVYCLNSEGELIWSFDSGGQIWSSASVFDIDFDNEYEIIITSLSKNLIILNHHGDLEFIYETSQFLVGTPSIGNLDEDSEKEIIFGGYHPSGKLFAVNHDGSSLMNFPIAIGEKIKSSVSLSDFNDDGYDEIIFGTESGQLWIIDYLGSIWEGFPIQLGGAIKSSPTVIKFIDSSLIIIGSTDGSIYGFTTNGILVFNVETESAVNSDISILEYDDAIHIFCGSDDNNLYGFNSLGDILMGFPKNLGSTITKPPVFSDLNYDSIPEIILGNASGELHVITINGNDVQGFPIPINGAATSSPTLSDLDNDGDVEIVVGTSIMLDAIDIKIDSYGLEYWVTGRNGYSRRGEFITSQNNPTDVNGDINQDELVNISDIILLVAFIIGNITLDQFSLIDADLNFDGEYNISDIVLIVDFVLGV